MADYRIIPASELKSEYDTRVAFQTRVIKSDVWKCCLNCDNWNSNNSSAAKDGCAISNSMIPPPSIIVHGCERWEFAIPF